LEEINGDLLGEDCYRVIVTKVLRFFVFGTGRILQLLSATLDPAAAFVWQPSEGSRLDGAGAVAYILFSSAYWTRMLILRKRGCT
jgi:hypothetical protein